LAERELDAAVYRIAPDGAVSLAVPVEYPNGLALSPDERTLYIANTRWCQYVHAVELDSAGNMVRRRVFADMSADGTNGVPDGMKVDQAGRVFCTGTGGVWVFAPDGSKIGIIEMPEVCANCAFGGPDLRTLFLTASTSVYTLRVKTPGMPHPYYKRA
jgi:gluconolactonase